MAISCYRPKEDDGYHSSNMDLPGSERLSRYEEEDIFPSSYSSAKGD